MDKKLTKRLSIIFMVVFLVASACAFIPTARLPFLTPTATPSSDTVDQTEVENLAKSLTPQEQEQLFAAFWQVWDLVHQDYVDQPVDDEALMRGAIRGMLDALGDQHTSYMDPQQYKDATTGLEGEYEGIGAWVSTDGEYLTINEPMPGSPAEEAGLKPGDQVIGVDGEDVTGLAPELVRMRVLGPKDSTVILTILRTGVDEPLDVEIQRGRITVPSVTGEMKDGDIAYIRLYTFGDKTTKELRDSLEELLAQNPKGLILDLRNNGGGYLQTAVEVTSEFVDEGVVLYEVYNDRPRITYDVLGNGMATDIPMVVLINEYSASASEIVAGALQDHQRATLVGETSFGKGSVQQWIPLVDDQGAAKITIARWLTPNGRQIHEIGLTPDYEVVRDEINGDPDVDEQLAKALELLR